MRQLRAAWSGLAVAAALAATPAAAQTSQTNLNVRDASGTIIATCAFASGGATWPCHLAYGADAAGALHVVLTDTAGHPLVGVVGAVEIEGGNATAVKTDGSGVVQPVSASALPLPANAAQESGGHLASIDASAARLPAAGQAAMAGSLPVAIASNQSPLTIAQATPANLNAEVTPLGAASVNNSGAITTGGTFQTLLAANAARKGCLIENPVTATELLYVSVGPATGSASLAKAFSLAPGAALRCNTGPLVVTDNIAVEAATSGHAFVEADQ